MSSPSFARRVGRQGDRRKLGICRVETSRRAVTLLMDVPESGDKIDLVDCYLGWSWKTVKSVQVLRID